MHKSSNVWFSTHMSNCQDSGLNMLKHRATDPSVISYLQQGDNTELDSHFLLIHVFGWWCSSASARQSRCLRSDFWISTKVQKKQSSDQCEHLNWGLVTIKALRSLIWNDILHSTVVENLRDSFNYKLCVEQSQQAWIHSRIPPPPKKEIHFLPFLPKLQTVLQWTITCFSFWG